MATLSTKQCNRVFLYLITIAAFFLSCDEKNPLGPDPDVIYTIPKGSGWPDNTFKITHPPNIFHVKYTFTRGNEAAIFIIVFKDSSTWKIKRVNKTREYVADVDGDLAVIVDVDKGNFSLHEIVLCQNEFYMNKYCGGEGPTFGVRPKSEYEFTFIDRDDKVKTAEIRFERHSTPYGQATLKL